MVGCGDSSGTGGTGGSATTTTTTTTTGVTTSSSTGGMMGKPIGSACATNADCAGGLCITEESSFGWSKGYCSALCEPMLAPCAEGDCLTAGNTNVCIKKCDPGTPADCNGPGQACIDISGGQGAPANYCLGGCNMQSDCLPQNKCDLSQNPDHGSCVIKEVCHNMMDDNGDSFTDCADPDCAADAMCVTDIGNACTAATALVPGTPINDTTANGTNLFGAACPGLFGAVPTGGGKEHVYSYTATGPGILHLSATANAGDLGLYVRTTCADGTTDLACADNTSTTGKAETADVVVKTGDKVTVFVDAATDMTEGAFKLDATFEAAVCGDGTVTKPEQCDDHNMANNDGCDSMCKVEIPYVCSHATPISLGTTNGNTVSGTNAFSAPQDANNCSFGGAGVDGNEQLYVFTPAATGMLTITVTPTTAKDLGVYARTTCADVASQVGCSDAGGSSTAENLTIPVTANVPVTIFVDAFGGTGGPYTILLVQN